MWGNQTYNPYGNTLQRDLTQNNWYNPAAITGLN
ncbi:unnamed protein product, partial [Adineta steineri]